MHTRLGKTEVNIGIFASGIPFTCFVMALARKLLPLAMSASEVKGGSNGQKAAKNVSDAIRLVSSTGDRTHDSSAERRVV